MSATATATATAASRGASPPSIVACPYHDRLSTGRLKAMAAFIAAFEAEHGEITEEEIESAGRRAPGEGTCDSDPRP